MNVAGAIHAAGSRQLKDFTWGEIVVNIINSLVDEIHPPITIESTGKSIIQLLDKLSDREKNIILSYPISLVDENGDFSLEINNKETTDKVPIIIISVFIMITILSFVISFFQASVAFDNKTSLSSLINPIFNMINQLK